LMFQRLVNSAACTAILFRPTSAVNKSGALMQKFAESIADIDMASFPSASEIQTIVEEFLGEFKEGAIPHADEIENLIV